jgi:hypothetical protein
MSARERARGSLDGATSLNSCGSPYAIGRRVCGLIEATRRAEPALLAVNQPLREDVNRLLPALIRLGVAEAARLEQALAENDRVATS